MKGKAGHGVEHILVGGIDRNVFRHPGQERRQRGQPPVGDQQGLGTMPARGHQDAQPEAANRAIGLIHQRLVAVEASSAAVALWQSLVRRD